MANAFEVSNLIAQSTTEFYVQKNPLINSANRQFVGTFKQNGYATGGSIDIKVPGYPTVQRGLAVTAQDIQDLIISYTITENDIYSVPRNLSVYEEIFDILGGEGALTAVQKKAIVDNYAWPAYEALAGETERTAASRLKTTAFISPIDGLDVFGSLNTFSGVNKVTTLMNELKWSNERYFMMNEQDSAAVAESLQNMFNPVINKRITETALVGGPDKGRLAGLDCYHVADLLRHTAGDLAGVSGITFDSISGDGTEITLSNVTATTDTLILAGDRISIPSVYLLNPITFAVLSTRLVVTAAADADGDGAGNVTFVISFPLMASGEHANVSALPSNGAPCDVFPDYKLNFAYVPSGLSAVPLPLGDIYGAKNSNVTIKGNGMVPIKVQLQGSVLDYTNVYRISQLIGIRAFAPYCMAYPTRI